jgi:hypothetical protein
MLRCSFSLLGRADVVLRVIHSARCRRIDAVLVVSFVRCRSVLTGSRTVFAGRWIALLGLRLRSRLIGVYAGGQEGWPVLVAV